VYDDAAPGVSIAVAGYSGRYANTSITPPMIGVPVAENGVKDDELMFTVAVHAPDDPPIAVHVPVNPLICVMPTTPENCSGHPTEKGLLPDTLLTVTTALDACVILLIA
jgi:hypothetical protein